jgi:YidC/Oxa1 family membrane protein insertase
VSLHLAGGLTTVLDTAQALAAPAGPEPMFAGLWGWMRTLCLWLLDLLRWLDAVTGNWGVAIILVALLIRLATYPFARRALQEQKRFNEAQRVLGPRLREIKQNYRGGEQSERLIALYREHKVNPAAGVKPLLILLLQLPVFVALFQILRQAPELRGATFLWIGDLSQPDRLLALGLDLPWLGGYLNLMPVLMVASIMLAAATAPKDPEAASSRRRWLGAAAMALVFFVLFYRFPAGLVLYWVTVNLLQVAQQLLASREPVAGVKPGQQESA